MYNIITIERRYASGGNEIGKKLAQALGYSLRRAVPAMSF